MSSVDGLDEVYAMLDGLKGEILAAAKQGLAKGSKRIVGDAKALCPEDTGGLRNSITSTVEDQNGRVEAKVSATAAHAVYVEMGTGPVGEANHAGISPNANPTYSPKGWTYMDPETGEYRHTRGQPAQPYMYPAYKGNKAAVIKDVADAINHKQ